jgi:fructose/tagatose bisphosphate aldolase
LIRGLPEKGTPDNPIVLHGTNDEMREQIRKSLSLGYDEIDTQG